MFGECAFINNISRYNNEQLLLIRGPIKNNKNNFIYWKYNSQWYHDKINYSYVRGYPYYMPNE